MRFFLTRRWFFFAAVVVVLAVLTWRLGAWQFDRLDARQDENAVVTTNLDREPVPAAEVLDVGRAPAAQDEWRRVTATGTYDDSATVVVRYQTRDGGSGVDLVTPLRTTQGPWLLVDRGWTPTQNRGGERPEGVTAPSGEVTVTGWVRTNASEDVATVTDGSTRAISSVTIAPLLEGPVYGGFVDARTESPAPAEPLVAAELPDLGNGPHFFYGLQWWFFGLLGFFGFLYLAFDERRQSRRVAAGLPARAARRRHGPRRDPGPETEQLRAPGAADGAGTEDGTEDDAEDLRVPGTPAARG